MTVNFDRKTIKIIAKRTLGRGEDDERPISSVYVAHLRHFLAAQPNEQDFTMSLDNGDGSVYCRVCDRRLPPGDGEPEEDGKDIFGSMSNLGHVKTQAHRHRKTLAINPPPPPVPVAASEKDITPGRNAGPNSHQSAVFIPFPRDSARSNEVLIPTSRTEQQGIDEDYLLALQLDKELNGPHGNENNDEQQYNEMASDPIDVDEIESSPTAPLTGAPARHNVEAPQEEFPFEETYFAQIQGILTSMPAENPASLTLYRESPTVIQARCLTCHFSVELPGSGSFEAALDDVMQGMAACEEHLKSPYHIRKRNEAMTQASGQVPSIMPTIVQQAAQTNPSTSYSTAQRSGSSSGKRRLPDGWDDSDAAGPSVEHAVSNAFSHIQHGFTSASIVHRALSTSSQQRGPNHVYDPYSPAVHYPGRHIIPLPARKIRHHQERPALHAAAKFATRRFQESHAATLDEYGSRRGMNAGDFNINYDDDSSHDVFYSPGDLDRRFKDFMHKALEEFKDVATVTDAQKKLNMRTENDLLDGMQVHLLPHQIIGVAWMLDQEKDEEKLGGILADSMGLGKTVQMIATMAVNRPPRREVGQDFLERRHSYKGKESAEHTRRTTLVLAPASLLQQWYEEFDDKTTPGVFRVHIHHGKDKLKTTKEIEEYDVIIASHQSVVMDFPKEKKKDQNEALDDDDDFSEDEDYTTNQRTLGLLAKVQWLRVIIDEAQSIRNKSTRLSTCVAMLDSRYRWCLTGTPITNTLADIYGFLRFCRFEPWNEWKMFNSTVARLQKKYPVRAGRKAQAILKPHLLRRTKDSKLNGRPIIRLGPKTIDMIELEFTLEERKMYESVEAAQKKIVSRFLREGTIMKNYSFILVMILRLRQLCCHPKLVTTEAESEELDAEGRRAELVRAMQIMGAQKVEELKQRLKIKVLHRIKAELGLVAAKAKEDDDDCPICVEPIVENRRVTSCAHEFCSVCINEVLQNAEDGNLENAPHCPLCRSVLNKRLVFVGKIFEPSEEELEELGRSLPKPSSSSSDSELQSKKPRVDDKNDDFDFEKCSTKETVEPSTKMQCMLDTILKWEVESPGDKTIVYSQWTSMLDLVEEYLKGSGIDVLRYDGRMNRLARVQCVAQFKKRSGPSIMLVSLKCGGVGLNLNVANRVINLDLAWNYATEAQAYDRVHRLGQQKAVTIQRLIIRDTIEERIIRLQAKKQSLSDAALGEGTGSKLQRLTARDIAQLFGLG